mgnify:CR=1 FL=1
MAKIQFKGLEEYTAKLNRLEALSRDKVIGAAVYDGAAIVADAIKAELQALPTDEGHDRKKVGPERAVKDALIQHMGVAPLQNDNGFVNVKVGFDGYNGRPTPRYPRGKPVPMLARAVRSGTSFMEGHDFVKTAVRKSRKTAEAAMAKRVEREIEKIME